MRVIAKLSFGLALVVLAVGLSIYWKGWEGPSVLERRTLAAIAFCLFMVGGFTILRVTAQQEKLVGDLRILVGDLRIKEHKTAEIRDLLDTTLSSIGDAVIVTDAKGIITFLNPAARRLSGWEGEAIGEPLSAVFSITHRWTGETVEDPAAVVLREGNVGSLATHTILTSKDGRVTPVGDSSAPIRDAEGNMIGVVLVFRDLTVAERAEELRLSLASIVDSSEDAIIGERPDRTITSWNDGAARIFGYSSAEMIGANISVLIPEGRGAETLEIGERVKRGERVQHYNTVYRRKDGTEITVDLSVSPIRDEAGHLMGISKIARDVTDSKRIQERLVYSQKVESLGALAGGVAHDFNNLLMSVSGNTSLILDEVPAGSTAANLAQNVLIATKHASHLTRQMLQYSGKGRFIVGPINLEKEIGDIAALFRTTIPKDVELRLDFDPDLPRIDADAGQLQQLMTNLVLNGAEAIESVGVVTISATVQELIGMDFENLAGNTLPPGNYVRLEVRDNGKGMDGVTQARIFDPFFTTKFPGRGLGLAAALGIVRGHKAGISVSSEPGKGTTFRVFLPIATRSRVLQTSA